MTELRQKVLAEIKSYKDDLIGKENLEKNLDNLYGYIEDKNNLKDDQDIKIFLYMNRDHAAVKPFSHDPDYTEINQIITGKEPNLIKEDIKLKDIFGDTYLEPGVLAGMKGDHLKKLTDASKADFYNTLKAVEDEEVKRAREDIYWPWNTVQQWFTPRTYERRMRGEDDNYKDLGLDVLENMAYTFLPGKIIKSVPKIPRLIPARLSDVADLFGKGSKGARITDKVAKVLNKGVDFVADNPVSKFVAKGADFAVNNPVTKKVAGHPVVNTVANFGVGNVSNPFVMEGLDALAYDDNENTDRKDFSLTDALIGSSINVGAPIAFKAPVGMVGRALGGAKRGPKISKWVNQLGEGKSISDISKEARELGAPKNVVLKAKKGVQNKQKMLNAQVKEAEEHLANIKRDTPDDIAKIKEAEGYVDWVKSYVNEHTKAVDKFIPHLKTARDKVGYKEYDENLFAYLDELSMLDETFKEIQKPKNYFTNRIKGTYEQKAELVDAVLNKLEIADANKYVIRDELLDILKDVKFDSDKKFEEYLLNYLTNKYGDMAYGDRASSLPIVGQGIKWLNERELAKKRQKVRDSFSNLHFLPEVKPDTTKESK